MTATGVPGHKNDYEDLSSNKNEPVAPGREKRSIFVLLYSQQDCILVKPFSTLSQKLSFSEQS